MSLWQALVSPVTGLVSTIIKEASDWSRRRDTLKEATLEAEVAQIKAKAELAGYIVKADVEWDLAWAGQAQSSWKDEWLLLLWSAPVVAILLGFIPALFFEGAREHFLTTIQFVKDLTSDGISELYIYGWLTIFAAVFGNKALTQITLPGRVEKITKAYNQVDDDIPDAAAVNASEAVKDFLEKQRAK